MIESLFKSYNSNRFAVATLDFIVFYLFIFKRDSRLYDNRTSYDMIHKRH